MDAAKDQPENAELNERIKAQNDIVIALQQAISNYKKTPAERKTAEYVEKKEAELDALWKKFEDVDRRFRNELPEKHAYFKQDLYATIGAKYNAVKTSIDNDRKNIKQAKETASNANQKTNHGSDPAKDGPSTSNSSTNIQIRLDYSKQQKIINIVQSMQDQALQNPGQSMQFYNMKLKTIEQHWQHAHSLHKRLWSSASENYDFDKYCRIEEDITGKLIRIQELVHEGQLQPGMSTYKNPPEREVKLPKVELPKFDGSYLNWRNFHDLFSELVDKTSIASCQKLLYLKSCLSGEAKGLIQHLSTTSDNYAIAWKTLNDRYENKRILVNSVLKQLLSQPLSTNESIASLKLLHDRTQECL